MTEFLLDNLLLLPFLFVTYLVLEMLEARAEGALERGLGRTRRFGPLFGALAGVFPQCGFSAAAASLYAGGAITAGTLVAVFLSTSDELIPVLISEKVPLSLLLKIVTVKVVADNPPAYSDSVWRTTASTLNLRSGAGTQFAILGKIKRGTGVTILESVGNWRRVKTFGGQVGWISASYLTRQATAKVTASALNVRKGPGTDSAILGSFKRGTRVNVQYTSGNWAYVTVGGKQGYVSLTYIQK
jgi:uncharacterized protein YgiM (DUF1202 family)